MGVAPTLYDSRRVAGGWLRLAGSRRLSISSAFGSRFPCLRGPLPPLAGSRRKVLLNPCQLRKEPEILPEPISERWIEPERVLCCGSFVASTLLRVLCCENVTNSGYPARMQVEIDAVKNIRRFFKGESRDCLFRTGKPTARRRSHCVEPRNIRTVEVRS